MDNNKPSLDKLHEEVRRMLKDAERIALDAEDLFPGMAARASSQYASDIERNVDAMFRAMQAGHRAALSPQSAPEKPRGLDAAMKNAEDLLAETRKSIDEMAASARREAEERRRAVLAAEEALRTAQEGIACLDGNPEVPAALLHTLSAFSDLSELFLSLMKGIR